MQSKDNLQSHKITFKPYDYYNQEIEVYDGYFIENDNYPGKVINHIRGAKFFLLFFN